jgi:ATP-dependent Lon protease
LIYIIEHYTYEPGVRKFKEILYEICSEINLKILSCEISFAELPYVVSVENIEKFLEERNKIKFKKINDESKVGVICGLWANSLGKGGIIPIETSYYPSNNFLDLKLTGMQGDVMKESMNVAKTLAWNNITNVNKKNIQKNLKTNKMQGIHIHCPEGATPKDGPSAGTAITTAIYSLLNNKVIKKNVAITGEINLQGKVTAIGGLELKILGGIRAGVTHFLFPKENNEDFEKFMKKYKDKDFLNNIKFSQIENIKQALELVIE